MENRKEKASRLVIEFFKRVWGPEHDLQAIEELMTEDYEIITGGKLIAGRDHFMEWVGSFQEVLQNAITVNCELIVNDEGSRVISRWICSGTNNGIFGLPPDGQPVQFTGIAIWSICDGRLSKCWVERSALEAYNELSRRS